MKEHATLAAMNADLTDAVMINIDDVIEASRYSRGCLIPVLERCQEIVGYLPMELLDYISRRLSIPGSTVYGVVTFYSYFSLVPRGRHTIKVCMGTACYVRGIAEVVNRIRTSFNVSIGGTTADRRFSLESVRCLGACGLAPVVVVDDDTHGGVTPDTIVSTLDRYE